MFLKYIIVFWACQILLSCVVIKLLLGFLSVNIWFDYYFVNGFKVIRKIWINIWYNYINVVFVVYNVKRGQDFKPHWVWLLKHDSRKTCCTKSGSVVPHSWHVWGSWCCLLSKEVKQVNTAMLVRSMIAVIWPNQYGKYMVKSSNHKFNV